MGIGPPTQDGFYYDFDVPQPFTPDDLIQIEGLMSKTISQNQPFIRKELTRDEAKALFTDQPYKLEIIDLLYLCVENRQCCIRVYSGYHANSPQLMILVFHL